MNKHVSNLISFLLVLLSLTVLAGAGLLLWRSLPEARPDEVDTLELSGVFASGQSAVEPEREKPYDGALPPQQTVPAPAEPEPSEPEPAPESAPEAESEYARLARQTMESMTLDEKIWQLFLVTPEAITKVNTATVAGEKTKQALQDFPVGGLVYFSDNLEDRTQVRALLSGTQSFSKIPLFLAVDEEGGSVSRIGANSALGGTPAPSLADLGRTADPGTVYAAGSTIARSMTDLGFNLDFAPVADVLGAQDAVIGDRSFGSNPELCASLAGVLVNSLRDHGVISCLKHFPGYGSAIVDDHYGASVVDKSPEELEAADLIPFKTVISYPGSVPFVMVCHLSYPQVTGDDTPADLSPEIVTELLRNKLQFANVIITDSHQMASITDHYSSGEAAVAALAAGCDMILMPADLESAADAVHAAIRTGQLTQARIDESVLRILTVKAEYGLLSAQ